MKRSKILLAESNRNSAMVLVAELRKNAIEVVIAADAVHAMSLAKLERPDVVVLSIQLAGGCLAALKRIRSNVHTSTIPIIALASASSPVRDELIAAGVQECIEQTAGPDAIKAAIARNLLKSLDFTQAPAEVLQSPARLADLQQLRLLDSPAEESFDLLTALTAKLLAAPTALLTLVDADRQFFKSQAGLSEPWAGMRQTRLSHSFCQWVVSGREELVIRDATQHPVLRKNLAIRDLGVVAYAGVPLTGKGGEAIGSFCVIDSKPREWSGEDLATLRDLADATQAQLINSVQDATSRHSGHFAATMVLKVARILRRYGRRLGEKEFEDLVGIIERQAGYLVGAF